MRTTFKATGTTWVIDIFDSLLSESSEQELISKIQDRIETFEKIYSRFRPDSIVFLMSQKAGEYIFPEDAEPMFRLYQEMYEISGGLVTPLIGQVLSEAGYDSTYSLTAKENISKAKKMPEVLDIKYSDSTTIVSITEPVMLDFGAFGKGYIIDIVASIIRQNGIKKYTVDAGGDIAHHDEIDSMPIRVGLENPDDFKQVIGVANVKNQSICGSSGNRRKWGKYHHIINPETVESPEHIKALWVVAESTLLGDAMTTALFFIEPEKLLKKYSFEYAIVFSDGSFRISDGFPGSMITVYEFIQEVDRDEEYTPDN